MAEVVYRGGNLKGTVALPSSKSAAHRALLCAALSGEDTVVSHVDESRDIEAMLSAVSALGAQAGYRKEEKRVLFRGAGLHPGSGEEINCLESGNTLRFVVPVAAALGGEWIFTGSGRLPQRPMSVYQEVLPQNGAAYTSLGTQTNENLPLKLSGKLMPGVFRIPGNISSQFISGLLFALPLLDGESEILLTSPLESEGYVELTLSVLRDFGVSCERTRLGWKIPGRQKYSAAEYRVEGDWSQAAFFLSMAALSPDGGKLRLSGLDPDSVQGDKACVDCFEKFGLRTCWEDGTLTAWNPNFHEPFGGLTGIVIDASQINDLVPALAVCGALARGETRIINAQRLRLKESDRLHAMQEAITGLGGRAEETPDGLLIHGVPALSGGRVKGENDHRVVMALAAASLRSKAPVTVTDAWSIQKTYPHFYEDLQKLGGVFHVIDVG